MEQFLASFWQRWQQRGAKPDAEPTWDDGWVLTLCFRAKVSAWFIFLLFTGGLVGVFLLQAVDPWPERKFWILLIGYSVLGLFALYYLIFVYAYRVRLNEEGLELSRFLLPTRRMEWEDLKAFEYHPGDETLKLHSHAGKKIGLYLSLHGLSYLRRCLATCTAPGVLDSSWATADADLLLQVPSWCCDPEDLSRCPVGTRYQSKRER